MSVPRRRVVGRLFVSVVLAWMVSASLAYAQQARVKVGPANVYERPRTSSDVVIVVPEGTLLDVLKREGAWYWVYLPPDPHGTRRAGYVPAYLVELVNKTSVEPGIPAPAGRDMIPPGIKRPPAPGQRTARYLFTVAVGGQFGAKPFSDQEPFSLYQAPGWFQTVYHTPQAVGVDLGAAVRLGNNFALGADLWHATALQTSRVTAAVPHPFNAGQYRQLAVDIGSSNRTETDLHMRVALLMRFGRRADLALFAGPSLFSVYQDFITGLRLREAYGSDTVFLDAVDARRESKIALGGNAGFDLTVMVWRFLGVGVTARYAYGSARFTSPGGGVAKVQVGGTQASAGLRVRF